MCEYESEHAPRTRLGSTDAATTRRPIEWRAIRALDHARRQFLAAFAQPVVAGLVLRRRSDFRILRDHREIKNVPRCVTFMKRANPFSAEVRNYVKFPPFGCGPCFLRRFRAATTAPPLYWGTDVGGLDVKDKTGTVVTGLDASVLVAGTSRRIAINNGDISRTSSLFN